MMFYGILKKEFLLIFRDIHALFVLFLMPTLFITIMSLALQNTFKDTIAIHNIALKTTQNDDTKELLKGLNEGGFARYNFANEDNRDLLYKQGFDAIVLLDDNFRSKIKQNTKDPILKIYSKADLGKQSLYIIQSDLIKSISKSISKEFYIQHQVDASSLESLEDLIEFEYIHKNRYDSKKPTSLEQSLSSWLIFSIFFILIPISNTFINERNFGTLSRIKSTNTPIYYIVLGKLVPYFIINQIQVVAMFLLAIYLLPIFGLEKLHLNDSIHLLAISSFAISFGAISFGLLIANISKTTEEATTMGGTLNIIFAALSGIMVPKFIMPESMQQIGSFSPMSWGLDSFLEILVYGGSFEDIYLKLTYLFLFGIICLFLATTILKRRL